ncbi:hypothetical protein J6590_106194, partial [Homalodisca vitripennis]
KVVSGVGLSPGASCQDVFVSAQICDCGRRGERWLWPSRHPLSRPVSHRPRHSVTAFVFAQPTRSRYVRSLLPQHNLLIVLSFVVAVAVGWFDVEQFYSLRPYSGNIDIVHIESVCYLGVYLDDGFSCVSLSNSFAQLHTVVLECTKIGIPWLLFLFDVVRHYVMGNSFVFFVTKVLLIAKEGYSPGVCPKEPGQLDMDTPKEFKKYCSMLCVAMHGEQRHHTTVAQQRVLTPALSSITFLQVERSIAACRSDSSHCYATNASNTNVDILP